MNENKEVIRKPITLRGESIIEENNNIKDKRELLNKNIIDDVKPLEIDNNEEEPLTVKKITKNNSSPTFITCLLTVLLIATYLLTPKLLEPVRNFVFNSSITAYPFTFLLIILATKKYTFKELRKSILTSSLVYLLFLLIMCIGLIPIASSDTMNYNVVIQYLFGINNIPIGDYTIFYPQISLAASIVIAYIISHLLYLYLFYALKSYSIDGMVVMLCLFISYIIDRTIFMPIYYSNVLINQENSFAYFVKCLTGEYVSTIIVVLILVIVFTISKIFEKQPKTT